MLLISSPADATSSVELDRHLAALKSDGLIELLRSDGMSVDALASAVREADAILVMLTPSLIHSPLWGGTVLHDLRALRESKGVPVLPILLDDCDWKGSWLGQVQGLPYGRPIAASTNRSAAWLEVALGLRQLVERQPPRPVAPTEGDSSSSGSPLSEERLDPSLVRASYHYLLEYHSRLLRLIDRTHRAIVEKVAPLPSTSWEPYVLRRPTLGANVGRGVAIDHIPLRHVSFTWASTDRVTLEAYRVIVVHNGDGNAEPSPFASNMAPALKERLSTLSLYVTAVSLAPSSDLPASWSTIDEWLVAAPQCSGHLWENERIHTLRTDRGAFRIGGLARDVGNLDFAHPEGSWLGPVVALVSSARIA